MVSKYQISKVNFDKSIDTKIIQKNGIVATEVNQKNRKLHWKSRTPKAYKRNSNISDLNWAFRISSSLKDEISKIRQKYLNGDPGDPLQFINRVIK